MHGPPHRPGTRVLRMRLLQHLQIQQTLNLVTFWSQPNTHTAIKGPLGVSAQVKGEVATWLAACCETSMEGRPQPSAHDEVVCAEGVVVGSLGPHTLQAQKFAIFKILAPLRVSPDLSSLIFPVMGCSSYAQPYTVTS
jgi:hypothetical protein